MSLLKTLYALAIALLVVAFVGFGISAFYPGPEFPRAYPELEQGVVGENPTEEEKQMLAEEQKEMEAYEERLSDYNRVVVHLHRAGGRAFGREPAVDKRRARDRRRGDARGGVHAVLRADTRPDDPRRTDQVRGGGPVGLVVVLALVYWRFIRSREGRRA